MEVAKKLLYVVRPLFSYPPPTLSLFAPPTLVLVATGTRLGFPRKPNMYDYLANIHLKGEYMRIYAHVFNQIYRKMFKLI